MARFRAESDDEDHEVVQYDLASLMRSADVEHVDLALADVQGVEQILLDRARTDFLRHRVRFLLVSTDHHSISGDVMTHQRALGMLEEAGGQIIAEHSISESFSGDGLIAVSFDPDDAGFVVDVSRARSRRTRCSAS